MTSPPPNTKDGKLGRVCVCGNHISEKDTHLTYNECLGLRHAREALAPIGTCDHCARLPMKSLWRRLARHDRLTDEDPLLSEPPIPSGHTQVATAGASTDRGERMEQENLRAMYGVRIMPKPRTHAKRVLLTHNDSHAHKTCFTHAQ